MSKLPARSPLQDLAEAIGTLERLNAVYHKNSPTLSTCIDHIEASLTYVLDPTSRLIQTPRPKR